ncbi:MAG: sodium:proton antiporter [Ruminococcaceae bacterium]|nr:sodium:proton antiporter [Oscillospiraceae bacterium]
MNAILSVSIALLAGLLMTRLFKIFKLPSVTSYLIAGVLIGPYCLGALKIAGLGFHSAAEVEALSILSDIALGFIAFSIGSEFELGALRKTGKQACVIGIFQALAATLLVDLVLYGMHLMIPDKLSLSQTLVLGAIATATAPAATLMVVRQYKAKGSLTSLLLPIVALDDAVGLVVFAVSFGIAKSLLVGSIDMISLLVNPLLEIVFSLALGAVMGWILTQLEKLFNSNTNRLNLTIGAVILTVALSMLDFHIGPVHISFSSLLTCMMLGTIFCNICPLSHTLMEAADKWTSPIFAIFFVISGAALELSVFTDTAIVLIGVVYIIFRSLGKYFGAFASAKLTKCSDSVCKYLGITLLPQAGVALGMCTTAMQIGEQGHLIRNITLFAVLIYELFGPLFTKMALTAAGDIKPMSDEIKNRRKTLLHQASQKND